MSVETTLLINAKYTAEEVITVLASLKMTSLKIHNTYYSNYCQIQFKTPANNSRMIHLHRVETSLGPALMLRFGSDDEGREILKTIGNRLGGFFQPNDCSSDNWTEFKGQFDEGNALPYFLKCMILEGKGSEHDLKSLKKYIELWEKTCGISEIIK